MGEANRRRKANENKILTAILGQSDQDVVQVPIQEPDGWYRGIERSYLSYARQLWAKHGGDRQLLIYRIDAFWIKQWWITPKGTEIERPDLIIEARSTAEARDALLRLYDHLGGYEDRAEVVRRGENGSVYSYFSLRYAMASSLTAKLPINRWELLPLVHSITPDGEEIKAVQTGEFKSLGNSIHNVDRANIDPVTNFEQRLFDQLIEVV